MVGEAEGPAAGISTFKEWLFVGSPASRVDEVVFGEEGELEGEGDLSFSAFDIRR